MTNQDELKIEGLEYARDFLSGGSARFQWVVGSQSLQSKRTGKVHQSSIDDLEKEGLPVLNNFLKSLGLKSLSINDIKKERINPEENWYHLTIDDKAVLERLICAERFRAFNDLLYHRLAAAMCIASETSTDGGIDEEFPLYKSDITVTSFLDRYTPELRYENPPALYLKSKEKLEFPDAGKMGIKVSQRDFDIAGEIVKTYCFKITDREEFLQFFDKYSWFDEGYQDIFENFGDDSTPREYWFIINACKEMGIPVSCGVTTFGNVHPRTNTVYFTFPKEMSPEEQLVYYEELKEKLKDSFHLITVERRGVTGYEIVGKKVNYYKLGEFYESYKPQEKLKAELKSILQSIEELKQKSISTPAQILEELKVVPPKIEASKNIKELDSFNVKAKTPVQNKEQITSVTLTKESTPPVKQCSVSSNSGSVPVKQSSISGNPGNVPVKQTLSSQEKNNKEEKSGCILS